MLTVFEEDTAEESPLLLSELLKSPWSIHVGEVHLITIHPHSAAAGML